MLKIGMKSSCCLLFLALMLMAVLISCSGPAKPASPAANVPTANALPVPTSPVSTPQANAPQLANKVEVIYFHTPQRCPSCLCFEQHVASVINTYFKNELASGQITYQVINTTDKTREAVIKKYQAMGTQLFINTIRNGIDEIRDIQDIWSWKCLNDAKGFEAKVKNLIEIKLKDASSS